MRYNKFVISRFKGINSLTVKLDKVPRSHVFALVGLNESGKTTILEAIHWLCDPSSYDEVSLIPRSMAFNFNGEISVEAELELSESDLEELSSYVRRKARFKITGGAESATLKRAYRYDDSTLSDKAFSITIPLEGKTSRMKAPKELEIHNPAAYEQVQQFALQRLLPPIIYYENFLFNFPDKLYLALKEGQTETPEDEFYQRVVQDV